RGLRMVSCVTRAAPDGVSGTVPAPADGRAISPMLTKRPETSPAYRPGRVGPRSSFPRGPTGDAGRGVPFTPARRTTRAARHVPAGRARASWRRSLTGRDTGFP